MKRTLLSVLIFSSFSVFQVQAANPVNTGFEGISDIPVTKQMASFPPLSVEMNPEVKAVFDQRPAWKSVTERGIDVDWLRKSGAKHSHAGEGLSGVLKTQYKVEVVKGHKPINVYVYQPKNDTAKQHSALLWTHGGGYIAGRVQQDPLYGRIVRASHAVVVAPEYRLAPEHPYPAAIEDSYGTLLWMDKNAKLLHIDPHKIAVAGRSAGGGLTAAVSLMARDLNGPEIMYQFPLYPMLDYRNETVSSRNMTYDYLEGKAWNREYNLSAWNSYLGMPVDKIKEKGLTVSPYAAPVLASSFKGLPPTYTMIGTLDPFRDETIEYVKKLSDAGVKVEFTLYPGGHHGFEYYQTTMSEKARKGYFDKIVEVLSAKKTTAKNTEL